MIMRPEVWMISITDNPISQHYKNICAPTWTKFGFNVNHFEAKTPKDFNEDCNFLRFGLKYKFSKGAEVEFTDTEKAVWYSHYFMWKKCWEENIPIIVIEHDTILLNKINQVVYKYDMVCMSHSRDVMPSGHVIKKTHAGSAYYITPSAAKSLLSVDEHENIFSNSDAWIHHNCNKYGKWCKNICTTYLDDTIGSTIEHN